ncbi:MAG TPA: hypothetical protein VGI38_02195 [Puia sp.]
MQPGNFDLIPAFYLAVPFLFLLILVNYLGYRFKGYHIRKFPGTEHVGIGPTEGSLLGLTALLLSFTFGMSASKYETRRQHIVSETNDIGTAILRCDMYPDSVRNLLRVDFKNYLETRLAYYYAGDNEEQIKQTLEQSDSISNIIWRRVALLSHDLNNRVASEQMVPALNAMIDIVSTRESARRSTVPAMILIVLCTLILISAFLSGYGSKNLERNKVLVLAFAIVTTLALYLVVDLDKPRQGFVNLNATEQLMENLRTLFAEHH